MLIFLALAIFIVSFSWSAIRKETVGPKTGMVAIFLFGLMTTAWYASHYFTGDGINLTTLDTLLMGIEGAGFAEYSKLIITCFAALIMIAFFANLYRIKASGMAEMKPAAKCAHGVLIVTAFLLHPFTVDTASLAKNMLTTQASDFHDYYTQPVLTDNQSKEKNLLFIYLESLERTYFDEARFPGLLTHLKDLIDQQGVEFTNIRQATGTGYTIAGMVATQCGLPLFVPFSGNSMSGIDAFYPKATCLGDILKQDGYHLTFMQGSSTQFSGIDKFYQTHGFDRSLGKEQLQETLPDKSYQNGWGLYDDTVLQAVQDEFFALSKKGQKFALFAATLDTHHPNGHLSATCKQDIYRSGDNPILNILKCSDRLITELVSTVLNSKYADNTVVVIASDHLAMRNSASNLLPAAQERRNLFVIFDKDAAPGQELLQPGAPFDVGPTVLHTLGINAPLGLGRNLFSSPSLAADIDALNSKIKTWRDEILTFWDFPKIDDQIALDLNQGHLMLGSRKMNLPVILALDDQDHILPYFQDGTPTTLSEQLLTLKDGQRFVWFDQCNKQADVFDEHIETPGKDATYCAVEGRFGQTYRLLVLKPDQTLYRTDGSFGLDHQDFPDTDKLKANVDLVKTHGGKPYQAELQDGFDFTKPGLPSFITSISGVSSYEPSGRWSDATTQPEVVLEFSSHLPDQFTLAIEAGAFGPNINADTQVIAGEQQRSIVVTSADPALYCVSFDKVKDTNKLVIKPASPTSPASLQMGDDQRQLGIAFKSLKVLEPTASSSVCARSMARQHSNPTPKTANNAAANADVF